MITGFEKETAPLNDVELELVPIFVRGLSSKIGEVNAVKSHTIIKGLKKLGYDVNGARVRKIINYIRINGLVSNLVATSKGYYIENDRKKVEEYVTSLRHRASAINAVADVLERKLLNYDKN